MKSDPPQLPLPQNKSELWLLETLRELEYEASAMDILDEAEARALRAVERFNRARGSEYLQRLADGKIFVDHEVSARLRGTRLYRLRDAYRSES